jgi:hypothetical protein
MSVADTILTWDQSPAKRASLNAMGGASLIDDPSDPPDPQTMPTAASLNQCQNQIQAIGKVAPAFLLDVVNNGSAASVSRFSAAGTNITAPSFTVSRLSAGLVQITWTAGTFPVSVAGAFAQMTTDAAFCQPITIPISNGVQVKSRNSSGSVTDGNFTIAFY